MGFGFGFVMVWYWFCFIILDCCVTTRLLGVVLKCFGVCEFGLGCFVLFWVVWFSGFGGWVWVLFGVGGWMWVVVLLVGGGGVL